MVNHRHAVETRRESLSGERALVTGGARGIGFGIAERLALEGASVVLADLSSSALEDAASRLSQRGLRASHVAMDVSSFDSLETCLAKVEGPIDILVNNAGIAHVGLFSQQEPSSIERMVAINLTGAMVLTRLVLPSMLKRNHGRLLFIASIQGIAGTPAFATYSATKGGMVTFAEALERELSHHAITVTTVLPPAVQTQAFREARLSAPRMIRWELFPAVSVEQVARRAVNGLINGEPRVYAGAQSVLAVTANRISHSLMGFILNRSFREDAV